MEAAVLSGSINFMLPKLFSLVEKIYNLDKNIKRDIDFLVKELRYIVGKIDEGLNAQREEYHGAVLPLSIEDLRELAHGIEDCIDSLIYCASWKKQKSVFHRPSLLKTMQFAQKLQGMKEKVMEARERMKLYANSGQTSSAAQVGASPYPADPDWRNMGADLVGFDEPRAKLLEQLAEAADVHTKQQKVISIVGSWGSGKTALAAYLYNRETGSRTFEKHAWVYAAHKCPGQVLADMLRQLSSCGAPCQGSVLNASSVGQLCVDVKEQLKKRRYFIVIDDIRSDDLWKEIQSAFPADKDVSSRVLVTTTIQSIATFCSRDNSYVHKMSRLDERCSEILFAKKACPDKYSDYQPPVPAVILKKCDGQPLALVTIGEFMQSRGWPEGPTCEELCNNISTYLKTEETFKKIRRTQMSIYASLPSHDLKVCLLYFGIFPSGQNISRKSLLRRWSAEGIIEPQDSCGALNLASKNFNKLMDQNIIEPIDVSNNDNVKTCQTFGLIREFISQMSISQNFVTLFGGDKKEGGRYVRHLSLHHITATDGESFENIDLSLVRSLTIFGQACETVLNFSKYKLLRVLDLEKCDDLENDHLKGIGNLLLLKYLSLGGSVTRLPRAIAKLEHLEALDVRRTKVDVLPVEVFLLPCLIHILGKFKLSGFLKMKTGSEVQKFLTEGKSNVETLAGFVTDGSEGFLHLVAHMKKLRKVKIWCKPSVTASSNEWTDLMKAIQQFIKAEKDENMDTTRSLSLYLNEVSEKILYSLKGPCYLSSLKLHSNFTVLPQFFISLQGLKELCLLNTKFTTGVLEALRNLKSLRYLKLIAHELEKFIIDDKALPNLVRLCLELQCPTFPTIKPQALCSLVKLQLLCKDLNGLSDINIKYFKYLQEVTLHPEVSIETKIQWEKAAKEHPNRPRVLLLKSGNAAKSSNDQLTSTFNNMRLSEVSTASNEVSTSVLGSDVAADGTPTPKLGSESTTALFDADINGAGVPVRRSKRNATSAAFIRWTKLKNG